MAGTHRVISEYFSGVGNVLASDIDANGNTLGYRFLGNVSELTINNSITSFDHRSNSDPNRPIDLRLTQALDINVTMNVESFTNENISLALFGDTNVVGAGVGVTVTTPAVLLGFVYPLDKLNVSSVVVTDNATGLITYVEGPASNPLANYELDEGAGSILIHADQTGAVAAITAAEVLDIDFDHAAQVLINAQTQARPVIALRFEGLNTAKNNEPVVVDIFKFNTDPLAAFNMLNEEVWNATLEGILLVDNSKATGSQFYTVRKL